MRSQPSAAAEACIITIDRDLVDISFNSTSIHFINKNTSSADHIRDLDLVKTILGFALRAALALLYGVVNIAVSDQTSTQQKYLETFIIFSLVAFYTALGTFSSREREQRNNVAVAFKFIAVLPVALAVASLVSIFVCGWFRLAAYVLCMLSMYAMAPACLLRKFAKLKAKIWRSSDNAEA